MTTTISSTSLYDEKLAELNNETPDDIMESEMLCQRYRALQAEQLIEQLIVQRVKISHQLIASINRTQQKNEKRSLLRGETINLNFGKILCRDSMSSIAALFESCHTFEFLV